MIVPPADHGVPPDEPADAPLEEEADPSLLEEAEYAAEVSADVPLEDAAELSFEDAAELSFEDAAELSFEDAAELSFEDAADVSFEDAAELSFEDTAEVSFEDVADPSLAEDAADPSLAEDAADPSLAEDAADPSLFDETAASAPLEEAIASLLDEALHDASHPDWAARRDELLEEQAQETDRARAALLAYEAGELAEWQMRDAGLAITSYGMALQSDPSLRPNLWAIRRVFYRRALWPNLLKLIDAEVRFARNDDERADLLFEKGQILEDKTNDSAAAKEAYESSNESSPSYLPALLARERMALVAHDDGQLRTLWTQLAEQSISPSRRVAYLLDLARLESEAGDDESIQRALAYVISAAEIGAELEQVGRQYERLAYLSNDSAQVLAALEFRVGVLQAALDDPSGDEAEKLADRRGREIVALRRRQSRTACDTKDYDRAWQYLQSALQLAPSEPLLAADMADLAEITERWDDLAELCARLAELDPDSPSSLTLGLRRADALTRSGRTEEADAALDTIAANAPGYLPVTALRERQILAQGDWERLVGLYLAEAAAASDGRAFGPSNNPTPSNEWAADAYLAAGDVFMMRLGRAQDARLAYEQALEASPRHWPAVLALCTLFDRTGQLKEAAELLARHIEGMAEDDVRAPEALELLAQMFEDAGLHEQALAAVKRLATLRPDDAAVRAWILDLYLPCGAIAERAELLIQMAESIEEPKRKSAAYLEAAYAYQHVLGQVPEAVTAYRKALEASPGDQYAGASLSALLWQGGQWETIVELRRAEAQASPAIAVVALREAASVLLRLGRPKEAAAAYLELGDKAYEDPHALRGLAEALRGDPTALSGVLEKEALLCADGAARGQALLRLAECYVQGRANDADEVFKKAEQAGGVALHALWGRISLAAGRKNHGLLGDLLAELSTREPRLSSDLLEDAAWLGSADMATAMQRLDELSTREPDRRSIALGRGLLAARQKDARALAGAVAAQAEHAENRNMAASLLVRSATLLSTGDRQEHRALAFRALSMAADDPEVLVEAAEHVSDEAVDYLAKRSELSDDDDAWADLEVQRGKRLRKMGRLAEAGRVVGKVLERVPGDQAALWLLRVLGKDGGDYETFIRASYQLAGQMTDGSTAGLLLREVASTLDELLSRESDAATVWRELLDKVPLDEHAYERAHALFGKERDFVAVHDLVSHRIKHDTDPRAQVTLRVERGQLRHKLGWQTGAAEDLTHVLDGQRDHLEALLALAEVRLSQGDPHESAKLLHRYLATAPAPDQARSAEKRLAVVLADSIGDLAGAQSALEDVLNEDPNDVVARERLAGVLVAQRDFVAAAEEWQRVTKLREDRIERAQDYRSLANVCRRHLNDPDRARLALAEARKLDALNPEIVRELSELTAGEEREQVFASAFADLRQAIAETPTQSTHYACLAGSAHLAQKPALELSALGALITLDAASAGDREQHDELAAALDLGKTPQGELTNEQWTQWLAHPMAMESYSDIWRCLADAIERESMPDFAALGFDKKDHLSARAASKQYPVAAAIGKALGVGAYDLYVTELPATVDDKVGHYTRVFSLSTPAICLSASVARGDTVASRFFLGRAFAEARLQSSALEELLTDELRTYFALGLVAAAGDPKTIPELADVSDLGERSTTFAKLLGRRDRKGLTKLTAKEPEFWQHLLAWRDAVRTTTRRAGLLFAGELRTSLNLASTARGGAKVAADDAALSLLIWGTSNQHMLLRLELGI